MARLPVRRRRSISAKGITSAQPGSIDRLVLGGGKDSGQKSRRRLYSCQLLQALGCSIGVEDIVTKAINVLSLVPTECVAKNAPIKGPRFLTRVSLH